jgi:hypothetical protein
MESGKLGLTLFDVLGYLLPGYVLVFCLSFIESTFLGSGYLSIASLKDNLFFSTVAAYFGGHVCHSIAASIKHRFFRHLGENYRLNNPLYSEAKKAILQAYDLKSNLELNSLDIYLLADSYLVASGCLEERGSLHVREGFHKSASAAFGFLFITIFSSLMVGGLRVQFESGNIQSLGLLPTVAYSILSLAMFRLFMGGFAFYNRVKLTNTYLIFLALRKQEKSTK